MYRTYSSQNSEILRFNGKHPLKNGSVQVEKVASRAELEVLLEQA